MRAEASKELPIHPQQGGSGAGAIAEGPEPELQVTQVLVLVVQSRLPEAPMMRPRKSNSIWKAAACSPARSQQRGESGGADG